MDRTFKLKYISLIFLHKNEWCCQQFLKSVNFTNAILEIKTTRGLAVQTSWLNWFQRSLEMEFHKSIPTLQRCACIISGEKRGLIIIDSESERVWIYIKSVGDYHLEISYACSAPAFRALCNSIDFYANVTQYFVCAPSTALASSISITSISLVLPEFKQKTKVGCLVFYC